MKRFLLLFFLFVLGSLAIVWVAFYNGYPLVYSDTGTYLNSSIKLISPGDRPIFYGFFLRITHMQTYNWISILTQGVIGYWLIYRISKLFHPKYTAFFAVGYTLALTLLTGLSWYASQLMPDIFTAYGVLALFLLIYDRSAWWITLLYAIVLFFSAGVHLSNVLILGGLLPFFWLFYKFKSTRPTSKFWPHASIALLLIVLIFPLQAFIRYTENGKFMVSEEANLFHVAKAMQSHMYQTYVKENKHRINIPFAEVTDSFPDSPMWFLWANESPLNTCGISRIEISSQLDPVVKDMYSINKYRLWFLKEMFRAGWEQLHFHRVGSGLVPYQKDSAPYGMIFNEFKNELPKYIKTKQFKSGLENNYHIYISLLVYQLSWIFFFIGILVPVIRKKIGVFLVILLLGVVFNALITGGLANTYDRLQVRVGWLISFGALLSIVVLFQSIWSKWFNKSVKQGSLVDLKESNET